MGARKRNRAEQIKEAKKTVSFAKLNNCNIKIIKGGSGKLWKMLKYKKDGDLFLPGSEFLLCPVPVLLF